MPIVAWDDEGNEGAAALANLLNGAPTQKKATPSTGSKLFYLSSDSIADNFSAKNNLSMDSNHAFLEDVEDGDGYPKFNEDLQNAPPIFVSSFGDTKMNDKHYKNNE